MVWSVRVVDRASVVKTFKNVSGTESLRDGGHMQLKYTEIYNWKFSKTLSVTSKEVFRFTALENELYSIL